MFNCAYRKQLYAAHLEYRAARVDLADFMEKCEKDPVELFSTGDLARVPSAISKGYRFGSSLRKLKLLLEKGKK